MAGSSRNIAVNVRLRIDAPKWYSLDIYNNASIITSKTPPWSKDAHRELRALAGTEMCMSVLKEYVLQRKEIYVLHLVHLILSYYDGIVCHL